MLSGTTALEVIENQARAIGEHWEDTCNLAELNDTDKQLLWGRQFLNSYAFENLEEQATALATFTTKLRNDVTV